MTVRQGKRRFQGESEVQAQLLIGATQLECGANLQRERCVARYGQMQRYGQLRDGQMVSLILDNCALTKEKLALMCILLKYAGMM